MDLISDEFVQVIEERILPTEEQKQQLKDYIILVVNDAGGKLDYAEVGKLCHQQFPAVFTWGEVEQACKEIQDDWDRKRAVKFSPEML